MLHPLRRLLTGEARSRSLTAYRPALWAAASLALALGAYAFGVRRGASSAPPSPPPGERAPEARELAAARPPHRPSRRPAPVDIPKDPEGAPDRISAALMALGSADPAERSRGLLALSRDDRAAALAKARGLLDDPTMIRAAAAVLLVGGGAPGEVAKEIPAVRAALDRSSCDSDTRTAVLGSLLQGSNYADPEGARRLAAGLMLSKAPEDRRAATPLLASLNASDAVPLLLAALDDPDPGVRQAALTTIRIFSHHDQGDSPEAWRAWWRNANPGL